MRTVSISISNNQKVELFVDKIKEGFEFWAVGIINGQRVVIDHHLTHDDLPARLEYAQREDLIWREAGRSEIPVGKHKNAVEKEETMGRGVFWDYEHWDRHSMTEHLGAIAFLPNDRKELITAKKKLLGRWTDGVLTFSVEPNHMLKWSCSDPKHPLNLGNSAPGSAPDWWNFGKWNFFLMNTKHKAATYVGVVRVNDQELHLGCCGHLHRMVQIFHRIVSVTSGAFLTEQV